MHILQQSVAALIAALAAGWAAARDLLSFFQEELGEILGPLLGKLVIAGGFLLMLLAWVADYAYSRETGTSLHDFGTYRGVAYMCAILVIATGGATWFLGNRAPREVPYTVAPSIAIGATLLPGLVLFFGTALPLNSPWLLVIAMGHVVLAGLQAELYAYVLAYIVLKVGQAIETGFQAVGGPALALAIGISLDDIQGRLAPVFDLIREQLWFHRIKGFPSKIVAVLLTYGFLVSLCVTAKWATLMAAIYFGTILLGYLATVFGNAAAVIERRRKFYLFLFGWGGIAIALVTIHQLWPETFAPLRGEIAYIPLYEWGTLIALAFVGGFLLWVMSRIVSASPKTKTIIGVLALLFCVHLFGAFLVRIGVISGRISILNDGSSASATAQVDRQSSETTHATSTTTATTTTAPPPVPSVSVTPPTSTPSKRRVPPKVRHARSKEDVRRERIALARKYGAEVEE